MQFPINRVMNNRPTTSLKYSRQFAALVTWSAAFSVAILAAILASLKQINPSVEFKFSVLTVAAFLGSGGLVVKIFHWGFGDHPSTSPGQQRTRAPIWLALGAVVLCLIVVTLEYVPREGQGDFLIGETAAFAAIIFVAWWSWRIVRILEAQTDEEERREEDREPDQYRYGKEASVQYMKKETGTLWMWFAGMMMLIWGTFFASGHSAMGLVSTAIAVIGGAIAFIGYCKWNRKSRSQASDSQDAPESEQSK